MTITAYYCSVADLQDCLSASGVTLRIDDTPPNSDAVGGSLSRATRRINFYAQMLYTPALLATSDWVNFVAQHIACYYLCARRGNPVPGSIHEMYEDAIADLKEIKSGHALIPDIAPRRANAPAMSNHVMRLRPTMHSRVQAKRSTGTPTDYTQRKDMSDIAQYGILDYNI